MNDQPVVQTTFQLSDCERCDNKRRGDYLLPGLGLVKDVPCSACGMVYLVSAWSAMRELAATNGKDPCACPNCLGVGEILEEYGKDQPLLFPVVCLTCDGSGCIRVIPAEAPPEENGS